MKTGAFFDKFSKEYESQDRYRYLFYRWMIKSIIKQIDKEDCDIVDVGTGTGNLAVRLAMKYPGSRILGIDVSKGMISEARAKCDRMGITNISFKVGSVERLRTGKVDFVVSALAFHHVKNKRLVLSSVRTRLAKEGKLVIGDWFEPSRQYKEEVDMLRRKKPRMANEFDRSWKEALKGMSDEYGKKHPKEYPVSQTELASIMKSVGFEKQTILESLLPNFAVVVGETKP